MPSPGGKDPRSEAALAAVLRESHPLRLAPRKMGREPEMSRPVLFLALTACYQAVLFTRFAPLTLPSPVARSHPGVAPNAGCDAVGAVVGVITAVQVAPLPAPPEMV